MKEPITLTLTVPSVPISSDFLSGTLKQQYCKQVMTLLNMQFVCRHLASSL